MASEINYIDRAIDSKLLNVRTAILGKVKAVNGNTAIVQPLSQYSTANNTTSPISAAIPQNVKCKTESITYKISDTASKTTTVLVPDNLASGDIVFVGICDRDITNAKKGIVNNYTRHHNINDGVILRVL